jgi:hypothetical protein
VPREPLPSCRGGLIHTNPKSSIDLQVKARLDVVPSGWAVAASRLGSAAGHNRPGRLRTGTHNPPDQGPDQGPGWSELPTSTTPRQRDPQTRLGHSRGCAHLRSRPGARSSSGQRAAQHAPLAPELRKIPSQARDATCQSTQKREPRK